MNSKKISTILLALAVLFLWTALVSGENDSSESEIVISNANFVGTSPEKENLNDEWVEVSNRGSNDVNLGGWTLSDAQNHIYKFPDFLLYAGASVLIHTGEGSNTDKDLYWGRSSSIWNNDGDTATLTDASGMQVSRYPS